LLVVMSEVRGPLRETAVFSEEYRQPCGKMLVYFYRRSTKAEVHWLYVAKWYSTEHWLLKFWIMNLCKHLFHGSLALPTFGRENCIFSWWHAGDGAKMRQCVWGLNSSKGTCLSLFNIEAYQMMQGKLKKNR